MSIRREVLRKRVLLTVLGTNPKPAVYTLDGRETEGDLAPVALFHLLAEGQRPDLVVALCTPEAKQVSFPRLEQSLSGTCDVTCIDVPSGPGQEDVKRFLAKAVQSVPIGEIDLVVDITHGFRHFSILTYLAALYLVALRSVRLQAAYYGLLRPDKPKTPFLDLRPLLELPRWIHAINVLREAGSAQPMAAILEAGGNDQSSQQLSRSLSYLSQAFLSGLPIELGRQAREFVDQHRKALRRQLDRVHELPLADELSSRLQEVVTPFALVDRPSGGGWKGKVPLLPEELDRQASIIDALFEGEHISAALGLLREWTVSWAVWRLERGNAWLDHRKTRPAAENVLGALAVAQNTTDLAALLTPEQGRLGRYWRQLSELRNAYHHHGMRPQVLVGNDEIVRSIDDVRAYWNETLRSCPADLPLDTGRGGRVLVTPLGMRPGVLFSALHACRDGGSGFPARCLVICSQQTEGLAAAAAERAGFTGTIETLLIDPFGGPAEIKRLVAMVCPLIFAAEQVLVNVTGGTTLMGLVAEAIAAEARKLARPVRRFGLIDRRPPGDQDADPYQVGEPFWLDREEAHGDSDD